MLRSITCVLVLSGGVHASVFDLPAAVVPGTASSGGPSFVLGEALLPSDTLRAAISGTVDFDLDNNSDYSADWNAAGVVVATRCTRLEVGGSDPTFVDQGWLRLAIGNAQLGYFPLLETSAENGLGSDNPPHELTLNRLVSDVIPTIDPGGLPAGTELFYRIYDTPVSDNAGAFVVTVVPAPGTSGLLVLFGVARRRRR